MAKTKSKAKKTVLIVVLVVLGLFLAVLIVPTIIGIVIQAQEDPGHYEFIVSKNEDGSCTIEGLSAWVSWSPKQGGELVIPATYEEAPVKTIRSCHRSDIGHIKRVVVSEGVENIYTRAFDNFSGLETIVLPSSIHELGGRFVAANVNVEFSDNEYYTYKNSSFIEKETGIIISAFNGATIGSDVTIVGSEAFSGVQFASMPDLSGLTEIGQGAFSGSNLTTLTLPKITVVSPGAFSYCKSLTEVFLPSVIQLEDGAFQGCTALTKIHFGAALQRIGSYAMADCPITDIYYNKNKDDTWIEFTFPTGIASEGYMCHYLDQTVPSEEF